jgi:hypothetical protein
MIRLDEKQTSSSQCAPRRRLEGHFVHTNELAEQFRRFRQRLQTPLHVSTAEEDARL